MSIFSLTPWFLSSIIVAICVFMNIGMIVSNKYQTIALVITFGLTMGLIINTGIDYNSQMYNREVEIQSTVICLKAEKVHLINQLSEIKKIQISNNSTHLEYVEYHIHELKNTREFMLSSNIETAKDAVEYIKQNPWLLK